MFSPADHGFMQRALQLAASATNHTAPNPSVGCVIVRDGAVLAEGFTQPPGEAHAEAQAIKHAQTRGIDLRGSTAYVTLEPCSHFGRTPPCCDALIKAGISRVVGAIEDPNPQVSGRGFARLRDAGVVVRVGLCAHEATEINIGFIKRMKMGLPWVRAKLAASLDARTALANGESKWITSPQSRQDGHRWRARASAILTGSGTLNADDPALTVRDVETVLSLRQPMRVIVAGQTPLNVHAQAFRAGALIFHPGAAPSGLSAAVECVATTSIAGRVDLKAMMSELGKRGVNELHVEAGAVLTGALIEQALVDELLLYMAPRFLGGDASAMLSLSPLSSMQEVQDWHFHQVTPVGPDLRLLLRPGKVSDVTNGSRMALR